VLGYTQAFSSASGLKVGAANVLAAKLAASELLPAIHGGHEPWRYTPISGVIIGTAAAWLTLTFSAAIPPDPGKIALVGAVVAGLYCLVGAALSFIMIEPESETLDE